MIKLLRFRNKEKKNNNTQNREYIIKEVGEEIFHELASGRSFRYTAFSDNSVIFTSDEKIQIESKRQVLIAFIELFDKYLKGNTTDANTIQRLYKIIMNARMYNVKQYH